ncbi:ankyrin repeat domain-containing protein [Pectobacterium aroidearum]|uniref:ankyrin repeat domain-containing protein n=1 Tax=Pectobacterium aroidearum TaxID=1201031 RepID=UPI0031588731
MTILISEEMKEDLYFKDKIESIEDLEENLFSKYAFLLEPSSDLFNEIKKQNKYKIKDNFNKTLLFKKYIWKPRFIKHLLKNGVDINSQDIYGKTAIFYCEDIKSLNYMLDNGANINHKDNNGCSALFYPVYTKSRAVIKEIFKRSDINIEDNEGLNFISYDFPYKHPDLIINSKDLIKNKSIKIKCIYLNFVKTWNLLNKHGFNAIIDDKVVLEYDPYTSKETLEKLIEMFDRGAVSIQKDSRFYIHEKLKDSDDPKHFFTLNELRGIIDK